MVCGAVTAWNPAFALRGAVVAHAWPGQRCASAWPSARSLPVTANQQAPRFSPRAHRSAPDAAPRRTQTTGRRHSWIRHPARPTPSVWREANGLRRVDPPQTVTTTWGDRQQVIWWVNDIAYGYGQNERLRLCLHVVVCEERWTTRDREGKETEHHARFAWVSGTPLSANNVVERCKRAARRRWDIGEHILACKHHGYQGARAFSLNCSALRGWHYRLLQGRLRNTLACYSTGLWDLVCTRGFRGALLFLREPYLDPWRRTERLRALRVRPSQLRWMTRPPTSLLPTGTAFDGAGLDAPVSAPRGHRPRRPPSAGLLTVPSRAPVTRHAPSPALPRTSDPPPSTTHASALPSQGIP